MADADAIYVVDTSSWLHLEEHPDINRTLDTLGRLVEQGRLKAPPEVYAEMTQLGVVEGWVKLNRPEIVERRTSAEYLSLVGAVTHKFPGMAAARSTKEKADPYVVALAAMGSGNPGSWVVVCNETLNRRAGRKIPTACEHFGVECIDIIELLRREFPDDGW